MDRNARRAALTLVPNNTPEVGPAVSFCSHCAARPEVAEPGSRVCFSCGLGLLLQAPADVAPKPGDPFLVLDDALSVCAVSHEAERLLAISETHAVNHHVTELLVPADSESQASSNLAVAVTWAARGDGQTRRVVVRPANTFGIRLSARITSCGPPTAALIVFD